MENSMVSFTVRMRFEEANQEAIAAILRQLTVESRQEPGCISYIAHFVTSDPATVVIYEQYADEAGLEHHRNTPHFLKLAKGNLYLLKHTRELEMLSAID
jgi:quinol monooxygenase YgiN